MSTIEAKKAIEDAGYAAVGNDGSKIIYQKGEKKLLFCAPCGWVKINYKKPYERTARFHLIPSKELLQKAL